MGSNDTRSRQSSQDHPERTDGPKESGRRIASGQDFFEYAGRDVYTSPVTIHQLSNGQQEWMTRQKQTDIKVFICYAREDIEIAQRLYADLERAGVSPWIDTEDLKPDQEWHIMINSVIQESSYVIALLSSHSLSKRGYVRKEMNDALSLMEEYPPDASFLIPVRLEACEPKEEKLRQFQWCDLFKSYEKGLNQILKVICPVNRVHLRSEPLVVSGEEFKDVFHLDDHELPCEYIRNDYKEQREVIVDHTTGLMWQKSGSEDDMSHKEAQEYVKELNRQQFAGYDDWRLPTIPELMSLLESEKQSNELFINPLFDAKQSWCWCADRLPKSEGSSSGAAWRLNFHYGYVYWGIVKRYNYVRCVRSIKSHSEKGE